jgi:hypothetical protein
VIFAGLYYTNLGLTLFRLPVAILLSGGRDWKKRKALLKFTLEENVVSIMPLNYHQLAVASRLGLVSNHIVDFLEYLG